MPRKNALAHTLSPRGEAWLRDALARKNLESGKRFIRVPLAEQLNRALGASVSISLNALKKNLVGLEAASELKELVTDLLRVKSARLVLERGKPALVRFVVPVVSPHQLSEALAAAESLVRLLRAGKAGAKKSPPVGIRVSDLRALLSTIGSTQPAASHDRVLAQLAKLTSENEPIVFVPTLLEALRGEVEGEAVAALLLEAHSSGRAELRPDSGVNPLSSAHAALCPKGPTGAPLSYVRLLSQRGPDHT